MNSIRRHLTVRLCILAAVLLPCGLLAVYLLARHLLVSQFEATLAAKAEALISAVEVEDDEIEIDVDVQHFAGFGSALAGDYFEVRTSEGRILARSPSLENRERFRFSAVPLQKEWRGGVELPDGNGGRAVAFLFVAEDDPLGHFKDSQIIVASNSTELMRTFRALLLVLLATGAVGLIAAIALIRFGLERGLQPLNSLAVKVQELKVDEPGLRLETGALPEELRGMGEKLNMLLERVEASIARERRFSSHAAHELRTPLAELKMMAEMIGKWPDEATPARSEEMVAVIRELEELLEKLSLLARADAGAYRLQVETIDLRESIERAIERESEKVASRGLKIQTRIEAGGIQSDAVLWQTILGNVLGNAVDYAPANSTIQVAASAGTLTVTNAAPELKPEDMDFVFDRFWRKSTAREGLNHSGVGLAIVKTCTLLLGWKCQATLRDGVFQIEIEWG